MLFSLNGRMNVLMFGNVTHSNGSWHNGRSLRTHLILYVIDGVICMKIDKKTYQAHVGDILFIPAGTLYYPVGKSGCTYYFFHFDAEACSEELHGGLAVSALDWRCRGFSYIFEPSSMSAIRLEPHFTPSDRQPIEDILSRAEKLDLLHHPWEKAKLDMYFRRFLLHLVEPSNTGGQTTEVIKQILQYIHEHIKEPISLGHIATHFYLSESYIARIFKKEMGESVGDYIQRQKVNVACALLMNSNMTIAQIAAEIGYTTPYYFSTIFSKWMGTPPGSYRKQDF